MSWARYWATRARAPLKRSGAAPFAARSWLTRLNSTPAAPPMVEAGGAGGLGTTGRAGSGRAATTPGWAAEAGVDGGFRLSLRRSYGRRGCRSATVRPAAGRPAATEWVGWDPMMATTARVSSGTLAIRVVLVTERDNSNPPCDLSWRRRILGRSSLPGQAVRRPRNPTPRLSPKPQSRYQAEAATKKSSCPSICPGRMAIIAR
jgi:hypothetical protein